MTSLVTGLIGLRLLSDCLVRTGRLGKDGKFASSEFAGLDIIAIVDGFLHLLSDRLVRTGRLGKDGKFALSEFARLDMTSLLTGLVGSGC